MDGLMLTLFNHICIHVRIVRVHLFFDSEIFFAIKIAETNLSKFFLVFFLFLCVVQIQTSSRCLQPSPLLDLGEKVCTVPLTHLSMDRNRKWVPGFGAVLLTLLSHMTSALEVPLDRKRCPLHAL